MMFDDVFPNQNTVAAWRFRPEYGSLNYSDYPTADFSHAQTVVCGAVTTYHYVVPDRGPILTYEVSPITGECVFRFSWFFSVSPFTVKNNFLCEIGTASTKTPASITTTFPCASPFYLEFDAVQLIKIDGSENPFNCFGFPPYAGGTHDINISAVITE